MLLKPHHWASLMLLVAPLDILMLCRMAHEIKGVRGRSMQAVAAAVLFCGCRQERQARTFKVRPCCVQDACRLATSRQVLMLTRPGE